MLLSKRKRNRTRIKIKPRVSAESALEELICKASMHVINHLTITAHNHITPEVAVMLSYFDLIWAHQYRIADEQANPSVKDRYKTKTSRKLLICTG